MKAIMSYQTAVRFLTMLTILTSLMRLELLLGDSSCLSSGCSASYCFSILYRKDISVPSLRSTVVPSSLGLSAAIATSKLCFLSYLFVNCA